MTDTTLQQLLSSAEVAIHHSFAAFMTAPAADNIGMVCALIGAYLIALNNRYSAFGFVFYLASNCAWIIAAFNHAIPQLGLQHIGFTLLSVLGLYRWRKNIVAAASKERHAVIQGH